MNSENLKQSSSFTISLGVAGWIFWFLYVILHLTAIGIKSNPATGFGFLLRLAMPLRVIG